jgi:hypothetical protein
LWIEDQVESCATLLQEAPNTAMLRAYPNPASEQLTLEGLSSSSRWSLHNAMGQTVVAGQGRVVDVSSLASGPHIVRAEGHRPVVVMVQH